MCDFNFNNYNEDEHCRRFAAWSFGVRLLDDVTMFENLGNSERHDFACKVAFKATHHGRQARFDIPMANEMIETARLNQFVANGGNALPDTQDDFNKWHQEVRETVIEAYSNRIS